eukprot:TRINITY_DN16633_c0_g1_i2.p2 TRINITY_DN16633_c0_g1~~TRINITY_DN16633_c0_g1_i2.p2  ORF type:complete len:100 (+),score=24.07 TRINITY_DN16633_c0_g1_i2:3-302(+)
MGQKEEENDQLSKKLQETTSDFEKKIALLEQESQFHLKEIEHLKEINMGLSGTNSRILEENRQLSMGFEQQKHEMISLEKRYKEEIMSQQLDYLSLIHI